jgi:hypothetical protein
MRNSSGEAYEIRAANLSGNHAAAGFGCLAGAAGNRQKSIYADYAALNKAPGVTPGLPLGLSSAARTVQAKDGKPQVRNGTYLAEGAGGYLIPRS